MTERATKAQADLPQLRRFADDLMTLVNDILDRRIPYKEDDDFGFMLACFIGKQHEHLTSIRCLVECGQDRDAGLVLRAMTEGLAMLLWVGQVPAERAGAWRSFAYVLDWRKLRELETAGEPIDHDVRQRVEAWLAAHRSQFYTDKAKACLRKNLPLPSDPYLGKWMEVSVRTMLQEVNGLDLYNTIYRKTSNWAHGNIRGIADALHANDGRMEYSFADPQMAATALVGGFQCLFQTAQLFDQYFDLGFRDRLSQLHDAYTRANSSKNAPVELLDTGHDG